MITDHKFPSPLGIILTGQSDLQSMSPKRFDSRPMAGYTTGLVRGPCGTGADERWMAQIVPCGLPLVSFWLIEDHLKSFIELSNPQFLSSQTQGEIGVLRWLLLPQLSFAQIIWGSSVVGEYPRIWTEDWLSKVNTEDGNECTGDREG
jgi:hypothetical protein